MDKLKHLIDCLKPHEVQLAEHYFKIKSNGKGGVNKKLKLFKLITSGKVCTDEEATAQLYDQRPGSAYSHLKKRLHEDILNLMLLSSTAREEEDSLSEEIKCRKVLIQGKTLISRGVLDEGLSMLQELSDRAGQFEFHDIKLAADDVLRTYSHFRPSLKSNTSYDENINESFNIMRKIYHAKQMNYEVRYADDTPNKESLSYEVPLRPERGGADRGSKRLYYWYNKFALSSSQQINDFARAENHATALLKNIKNNPKLYSRQEIADSFLDVSKLYFRREKYHQSIKYSAAAANYLKNHEERRLDALRIIFLSLFRKGDIHQSWEMIDQIVSNFQHSKVVQQSVWLLHKAALEFTTLRYQDSVKTLQRGLAVLNYKSDWNAGYRLMELMNILELKDFDWLEYKLEAYRKFIFRLHCSSKERYLSIYKLFKSYLDTVNSYQCISKCQNIIENGQLQKTWDPMGVEIINISTWFKDKIAKQPIHAPLHS